MTLLLFFLKPRWRNAVGAPSDHMAMMPAASGHGEEKRHATEERDGGRSEEISLTASAFSNGNSWRDSLYGIWSGPVHPAPISSCLLLPGRTFSPAVKGWKATQATSGTASPGSYKGDDCGAGCIPDLAGCVMVVHENTRWWRYSQTFDPIIARSPGRVAQFVPTPERYPRVTTQNRYSLHSEH